MKPERYNDQQKPHQVDFIPDKEFIFPPATHGGREDENTQYQEDDDSLEHAGIVNLMGQACRIS